MAKNVAMHGIWGVSQYEFSSSTSTPLFVLMLSIVYRIFGVSEVAPLVLSWAFGLASIYVASRILAPYIDQKWSLAVLVGIVLFTPLFVIGIIGMEHSLQVLLTLLFMQWFQNSDRQWLIASTTAFMVGTRYEGLFLAAAGVVVLLVMRRVVRATVIAVSAVAPVAIYALFSLSQGGEILPNTLILKGVRLRHLTLMARLLGMFRRAVYNSYYAPYLLFSLLAVGVMAVLLCKYDRRLAGLGALVVGSSSLHLLSADIGWCFRYEDYLIAAAIIAAACMFPALQARSRNGARTAIILFFCSGAFLMARSLAAALLLPRYSRAIFLQQYQTAGFLHSYYTEATVAANDIGLINFRNDLHCVDLVGLASREIFIAKQDGTYSTHTMNQVVSMYGVDIAVIYDSWFGPDSKEFFRGPATPATWIRVERWKVPERLQLGSDTVSFYAVKPDQADILRARLKEYEESRLPPGVAVLH